MMFKWTNDLEIGDEKIDSQHRQLFDFLNDLIDACSRGSDTQTLDKTLDFLVNYTVLHFKDEEEIQLAYSYPDYERHKQQHEDFKLTVGELVQRFNESGSSSELSRDACKIVATWFLRHIREEDKKIGRYIWSHPLP